MCTSYAYMTYIHTWRYMGNIYNIIYITYRRLHRLHKCDIPSLHVRRYMYIHSYEGTCMNVQHDWENRKTRNFLFYLTRMHIWRLLYAYPPCSYLHKYIYMCSVTQKMFRSSSSYLCFLNTRWRHWLPLRHYLHTWHVANRDDWEFSTFANFRRIHSLSFHLVWHKDPQKDNQDFHDSISHHMESSRADIGTHHEILFEQHQTSRVHQIHRIYWHQSMVL